MTRAPRLAAATVICVVAGCTTFEDPSIVLDLRVLAMSASPPDQVVDVDLERPMPSALLDQLVPTTVCSLVADPGQTRSLRWSMTACLTDEDTARCDPTLPYVELGGGVIADPDDTAVAQQPCADLYPGPVLLAILQRAVEADPVQALGGVDFTVMLTVGGVDADPADDVYAAKTVRVSPRIPASRTANHNPSLDLLDAAIGGQELVMPRQRCALPGAEFAFERVRAGSKITLFPVEPDTVRETYVVPTLDGQIAELTETMSYQWLAAAGTYSDETTGGTHDLLGNQSLLGSDWTAPAQVAEATKIPLWLIQRDERHGVTWVESCIWVIP